MRKKLHRIYWLGILITLLMAAVVILLMITMLVSDTRRNLHIMSHAAREWITDSNEPLQNLADDIAALSPPLRVTILLDHGLVLADSAYSSLQMDNLFAAPEVQQVLSAGEGESLRLSESGTSLTLYVATRLSSGLILRLSYPLYEVIQLLLLYAAGLILLFLILYFLQRRAVQKFARDVVAQTDDIRLLLEGKKDTVTARFPEFKPALHHISYLAARLHKDLSEVNRTLHLRHDFVAHASHELRSPLTSIMGFAEMLDEGMADSPEETSLCLSAIRNECERMLSVIEDILHLSHAEADAAPDRQHVSVHVLANEIISALQPQAANKRIALSAEGEMMLFAAEKDLWEILYNLISNAVKYGRDDGFVRVLMQDRTLTVEDNGIGIAKEHIPHLFEQFYRVDDVRGMTQGSTGLGLSIVKALCARYQADVRVESEPGAGSRFILSFPLIDREEKTV